MFLEEPRVGARERETEGEREKESKKESARGRD